MRTKANWYYQLHKRQTQFEIRDYENTEFGKAFANSKSIDYKVESDSKNLSCF